MGNVIRRDAVAIALAALACGLLATLPPFNLVHGWSIDVLTALRWEVFGVRRDPASTPVAVIAIDEETYETPPFKGSPTNTWTTEVGRVLNAVIDGGAKVVGFDIVFPTSIEQSEMPFGDDLLGARMHGFDRPFLRSLATGAVAGKVVLGEVLGSSQPSPGQRIAVGQQKNIRALNTYLDPDEVVRRMPLMFGDDGKKVPSMALELASRALNVQPVLDENGRVTLAGYPIPSAVPNTMTLNFEGGANDVQTFSFADLHACVERKDTDFFHREFSGKIVIFGTLLDSEDRRTTSKRLATGLDGSRAPRCALPLPPVVAGKFKRSTIAGVYIHATAVHNLMARDAIVEPGRLPVAIIAIAFAALAALAARMLAPGAAVVAYLGMVAVWTCCATLAFSRSLALPLSEPFVAGLASMAVIVAYRLMVTDRGERLLRRSFALYLAPLVIDKMLASKKLPELGGETRDVTVFFSDLAGFSSISEKMTPAELVTFMNEYLSAMTDIIESQGGYIDKYIGDSIVAVFGAPADDSDHASNAARAALGCRARLDELNRDSVAFQGHKVAHRMGLNSGTALVGNIGSRRRFNYSVMSDAVNVASRLEGANKFYGTTIAASETTVALTGTSFTWRELDAIRVQGRSTPVKIYELMAEAGLGTPQQVASAATYAEGLAHWRNREFDRAAKCFERAADVDRPSALFLSRANAFAGHPPGPDWEPVNTLDAK
ncbi:MAG: adenylate/guanylate cyclase domain-containing protein [Bradyrhizobium sp.]|uniref:adenylate/guanylate cyclase domain-containing protein n=1 Tax=Bradyrhizobium sp. TaxID=376 RepID=UPI00120EF9EE|nr:adenylate/guanylate cyclase domain-containing protein [Bradyrhizobium sp.]THD63588.1 MAG: adenylate/guanylate cyclase domain-containing protein [Bradyrhizobium sp.]